MNDGGDHTPFLSRYKVLFRRVWARSSYLICACLCCIFPLSTLTLYVRLVTAIVSLVLIIYQIKKVINTTALSIALTLISVSLSEIYFIGMAITPDPTTTSPIHTPRPAFLLVTSFTILRQVLTIQNKLSILQYTLGMAYLSYLVLRITLTFDDSDNSVTAEVILWYLVTIMRPRKSKEKKNLQKNAHQNQAMEFTPHLPQMFMGIHQPTPDVYSPHYGSGHSILQQTPRLLLEMGIATQGPADNDRSSMVNFFQSASKKRPISVFQSHNPQLTTIEQLQPIISPQSSPRQSVHPKHHQQQQQHIQQSEVIAQTPTQFQQASALITFEQISRESSTGILIVDAHLDILYSNASVLSFFGDCKQSELKTRLFQWSLVESSALDLSDIPKNSSLSLVVKHELTKDSNPAFDSLTLKETRSTKQQSMMKRARTQGTRKSSKTVGGVSPVCNSVRLQQSVKLATERRVSTRFEISSEDKSAAAFAMSVSNNSSNSNYYNGLQAKQKLSINRLDLTCNLELVESLRNYTISKFADLLAILLDPSNYKPCSSKPYRSDEVLELNREMTQSKYMRESTNHQQQQYTSSATTMMQGAEKRFDYQLCKNKLQVIAQVEGTKNQQAGAFVRIQIKVFQRSAEELEAIIEIVESSIVPSDVIEHSAFNDFKQRVLSSVSHELRTPLNCSMQLLDILSCCDFLTETQKKMFVTPALNSNHLLLCMINDVLDFAQILSHNLCLTFSSFNLLDTLRECITYFQFSAACKSLAFELTFDSSIPSIVHTDVTRFKQVIINLLSNAVKFTNKGTVTVSADLLAIDLIKISVADTGCGIPEHVGQKIFCGLDPQSNHTRTVHGSGNGTAAAGAATPILNTKRMRTNTKLNTKGAGLGLAIANMIAKGLGGNRQIEFESIVNEGSTFSFFILNRSKTSKGCYFQHQKVFSNTFSNWRTLEQSNQNSDVQPASNISFDQTSIIQHEKWPSKQGIMFQQSAFESRRKTNSSIHAKRQSSNIYFDGEDAKMVEERQSFSQSTIDRGRFGNANNNNMSNCPSSNLMGLHDNQQRMETVASRVSPSMLQVPFSVTDINSQMSILKSNNNGFQKPLVEPNSALTQKSSNHDDSCEIRTDSITTLPLINQSAVHPTSKHKPPLDRRQYSVQHSKQLSPRNNKLLSYNSGSNRQSIAGGKKIRDAEVEELQFDIQSFIHNTIIQPSSHEQTSQSTKGALQSPSQNQGQSRKRQGSHQQPHLQSASATLLNNPAMHIFQRFSTEPNDLILSGMTFSRGSESLSPQKHTSGVSNQSTFFQPQRVSLANPSSNGTVQGQNTIIVQKMITISEETCSHFTKVNDGNTTTYRNSISQEPFKIWMKRKNAMRQCECEDILVVDDNEFNAYALSMRLSEYGFIVEKSLSGFAAIAKIQDRLRSAGSSLESSDGSSDEHEGTNSMANNSMRNKKKSKHIVDGKKETDLMSEENSSESSHCCIRHKLIFMDIDMPEMNGHQTTKKILRLYELNEEIPPPIAACTAFVSDAERAQAKLSGMTYYMTKPVTIAALEDILKEVFEKPNKRSGF